MKNGENSKILKSATIFYFLLIILSLFLLFLQGNLNLISSSTEKLTENIFLGLISGLSIVLLSYLLSKQFLIFREITNFLKNFLQNLGVTEVLYLSVLSGLSEEIFFRGVLQNNLGLVTTAVIFGLCHYAPVKKGYIWTIFAICTGFLLGIIMDYTGQLFVPVITHFVVNFCNMLLMIHRKE